MTNFNEAVAARAGVSLSEADAMLEHHHVRESGILPRARRLALTSLEFSGTKAGKVTGDIHFEWSLADGLWCLAGDNLKGKSTVLEMIYWCLRGENSRLQDGVRRWISQARLDGKIDDEPFGVEFRQNAGVLTGRLETGTTMPPVEFAGHSEFESVMNQFMMNRLNLEFLRGWRDDVKGEEDGKAGITDWSLFSHALISRNRNAEVLLGETFQNGSVVSLLQMFIGLPWTSTRRDAETALKTVRQHLRGERRRATQDSQARADSLQELKDKLAEAEAELARNRAAPSLEEQTTALERAAAEVARCAQQRSNAVQAHTVARARAAEVHQALLEDQKRLRDLRENAAALRYFGALNPTCCPRCVTPVSDIAHTADQCSVCGTTAPAAGPEDLTAIGQLTDSVNALRSADRQAQNAVRDTDSARVHAEHDLASARQALSDAQAALPTTSTLRRQLDVERLRGALQEREATHARATKPAQPEVEERILEAARKEADVRAQKAQKPIMERVNAEIYTLAVRLGYASLQGVSLQANGVMKLRKDDGPTFFKNVSDGEQLRLRMATLLALLRVGQRHGGRHPGLLLIDSAGAQEMIQTDLAETLHQLKTICEETAGLQIIAATANRDLARAVIPKERARIAEAGAYMW
ncbi:hypothetical protein [Streptomyces microflavus]|uniref:hypothetical protein n=1 Tax=Streptomyces microflavus TaxID=1919 RepID=UPI002F90C4F1|nr:hypothetical protein OH770_35995 [Streptomyces microflavus]